MVSIIKKTSPSVFYDLSKQCVKLSESNELLNFLKRSLKKKFIFMERRHQFKVQNIFLAQSDTKLKILVISLFLKVKLDFSRIFRKLLLKKYK